MAFRSSFSQHLKRVITPSRIQVRCLNLHEYQSKDLMQKNGVTVQKFKVVDDLDSANHVAKNFKVREYVIKAQVLAGGRGKGVFDSGFKGGVHLTKDPKKVAELVGKMLNRRLVTKQTPTNGVEVKKVMVAEALDINRETYLAIVMDRESNGPTVVCSPCGGMDIEDVAEKSPEKIFKVNVDIEQGMTKETAVKIAEFLEFKNDLAEKAAEEICHLYELFVKVDATQIEINPFGESTDGRVVCFDAKINFDENAKFRQAAIFELADTSDDDPREVEASKYNLNYIGLQGNIGCMVNGAGLAMATMDMIKLHGGEPANFLDVGGGVNESQISQAFRILTSDPQVKVILVNIFGGIVNCAIVARGIVSAARTMKLTTPLVVRIEGTNVEEARKILNESGMKIITGNDLDDAAVKAVDCLKGSQTAHATL